MTLRPTSTKHCGHERWGERWMKRRGGGESEEGQGEEIERPNKAQSYHLSHSISQNRIVTILTHANTSLSAFLEEIDDAPPPRSRQQEGRAGSHTSARTQGSPFRGIPRPVYRDFWGYRAGL
jgi:hypothetical protein